MLRGIRHASSSWIGKSIMFVVVAVLVVSFAIWGIGDIFRGFGRSTVAKIGDTEITVEQFRLQFNDRLQQLGRQLGRPVTMEQARLLGLDRQLIAALVTEYALDQRARDMRLGVSNAEISRQIADDPNFRGPNGQFDRTRFEYTIRQFGFTEARYVADQRRLMMRRQLTNSITAGPTVPQAAVEAVNRFQNEERAIDYVVLDAAKAGEIAAPTPDVLAKYFDENKGAFRAPEYRKIVIVPLLPAEIARWIEVSDADAKKAYEDRKSRYTTPERRHVLQIAFPNEAEAQAAAEKIAGGAKFADIAKERNLSEKDIDLGTVAKGAIIDRAVADAAFALKAGEVSAPIKGRFGTMLVTVVKIEPEVVRPYEQVADTIKRELAIERGKAELHNVYDKIEDERAGGKNLADAAAAVKVAVRTVEVDRSGRDMSGAQIADLPEASRLLAAAFTAEPGVENDPIQVDGGYIWYEVGGITPARDRTLDEVKDQVEVRWRNAEIAARLKTKANELLDRLKAGTPLADAAHAASAKVESATGIKRGHNTPPISTKVADAIFRTAKDAYGSSEGETDAVQVVFRVTGITIPKFDATSTEAKALQESLNRAMDESVLGEYVAEIESKIGVTINQTALNQVIRGTDSN